MTSARPDHACPPWPSEPWCCPSGVTAPEVLYLLHYGTGAQQETQAYAREAGFLRIITTPAIPRLSNNQEDDSR